MRRRLIVLLALPLLLVLAACAPARHIAGPSHPHPHPTVTHVPSASVTPSATPTATAPVAPATVNPATYLIEGTPNVPDANGEWYGQWAFFTDSTKTVWCQFVIFSADNPGASCSIVPADHALATYPRPAGSSADCSTNPWDGYTLAEGASADDLIPNADAGWDQCIALDPDTAAEIAKTLVLPEGATLTVAPFSCTTKAGVGTCTASAPGEPSTWISLGLHTATFHSTL
jgi:hypothetical protein